jgi:arylsulfatase
VPTFSGVRLLNRPHSITAEVEIPGDGAEGVLLCHGDNEGGYVFYVKDQKLHYAHNYVARHVYHVESKGNVPDGRHQLRYEFEVTGEPDFAEGKGAPGSGRLYIDGNLAGEIEMPFTTPFSMGLSGGICVGALPGAPITPELEAPFAFTGTIHGVTVDVGGNLITDSKAEMRIHMARQ